MIYAILILWAVCAPFGYSLTLAHFQKRYARIAEENYWSDVHFALFVAAAGPIGLLVALLKYDGNGIKWR